jgi:hypothetical protein
MERDAFSRLVYFMLKNERGLLEISFNAFRVILYFFTRISYVLRIIGRVTLKMDSDVRGTDLRDGVLYLDECRNCAI